MHATEVSTIAELDPRAEVRKAAVGMEVGRSSDECPIEVDGPLELRTSKRQLSLEPRVCKRRLASESYRVARCVRIEEGTALYARAIEAGIRSEVCAPELRVSENRDRDEASRL